MNSLPKYSVKYDGKKYVGDSVDDIAKNISKRHGISFVQAVLYVNKNIIEKKTVLSTPNQHSAEKKVELGDAIRAAVAVLTNDLGGSVDQSQINGRAVICSRCPLRKEATTCKPCGGLSKFAKAFRATKRLLGFSNSYDVPSSVKGKFCSACSCSIEVMIPAKITKFAQKERKNVNRPYFCWVRAEKE